MNPTTSKPVESRSLIAGYLRISWTLSGLDPAEVRLLSVLDCVGSDALDRVVAGILNKKYQRILIDLTSLDRVTTAGVEGLMKVSTEIRLRSARLALVGPSAGVVTFIENLGLTDQFDIYPTVEEAVRGIEAEL
ncbi:MAG: STAS domain-containing protein [Planctomycetota bacterium]